MSMVGGRFFLVAIIYTPVLQWGRGQLCLCDLCKLTLLAFLLVVHTYFVGVYIFICLTPQGGWGGIWPDNMIGEKMIERG